MPSPDRIIRVGPECARIRLSVLTPFYRDDPSPLLEKLHNAPDGVELVLLDDGSSAPALLANVVGAASRTGAPARILSWDNNQGRAAARNALIEAAQGEYVLFLDADMAPDAPNFLARWLDIIDAQAPQIAFGGLSVKHATRARETALHYNMFAHSDCHDAARRAGAPAQSTASANLLVRRELLAAVPFDSGFTGWGFEDTEGALRAAAHAPIVHVDNPATHTGLDSVDTLLRKSAEAGPNFARLLARHPQAERFAAARTARVLRHTPARRSLRSMCAAIARGERAPLPLRRMALKLYRAAHFAEHLP